jgi:flagellin
LAEIDRIATQTSFNGQKILDGTFGNAAFQVGANVGETINVALSTSMRTTQLGKTADYVGGTAYNSNLNIGQQGTGVTGAALASGAMNITLGSGQAISIGGSASYTGNYHAVNPNKGEGVNSAYAKAGAINAAGIGGLTATADTTAQYDFGALDLTAGVTDTYSLTINNQAIYTATTGVTLSGDQVAAAINANASVTGVTATYDATNTRMTLQSVSGGDIDVTQAKGAGSAGAAEGFVATEGTNNSVNTTTLSTAAGGSTSVTLSGSIRLVAAVAITLGGAPGATGYGVGSLALGASGLNSASVTTVQNANTAISRIDAALSAVSTLRSTFGAVQNRFESTISNLQATAENLTASRSRIQDADFAAETAALTRNQILQQAGMAMLAQANSLPQNVMALLRG